MVSTKSIVAATAAVLASTVAADVDPIVIKGSKFFYKTNGTQFFIKGVAYQQDIGAAGTSSSSTQIADPLTDSDSCNRDIPNLLELQTNTIRVYSIDPTQNHDACMSALASAGIYVLADLPAPNDSINQDSPSWNDELYARYTSVIDTMSKYTNTLGFFAGNEVSNNASNIDAMPFVKAAVRDSKAYIKQKNYRLLGVGYAADDDPSIRNQVEDYLNCDNAGDSIDFYGYNIYSWCGQSSFSASHYQARTEEFANYSVPAFFAEYGCNTVEPRLFDETLALYSSEMTGVWSGGVVFEYFQAPNNFGLVTIQGSSASKLPDFTRLSKQIASVTPTGVNAASYTPTNTALRACPTGFSGLASTTNLPPSPNEQLCSCMVKNLTCVAKSSVNTNAFNTLFGIACDPSNGAGICNGITANGSTGVYGAYSMCSAAEQLSWAFNALYEEQAASNSANTDACDFNGNATKQSASLPSGCGALVSQAGAAGTGVVTSAPSGTGVGAAASSSSGIAIAVTVPSLDMGLLKLGAYVATAALVGVGMIVL